MATFLVEPPPPQNRMGFMDALDDAGIIYVREPDGYYLYLKDGQDDLMVEVCARFQAPIVEEDPPSLMAF